VGDLLLLQLSCRALCRSPPSHKHLRQWPPLLAWQRRLLLQLQLLQGYAPNPPPHPCGQMAARLLQQQQQRGSGQAWEMVLLLLWTRQQQQQQRRAECQVLLAGVSAICLQPRLLA
jgi:hypothetical protein